MNDIESLDNVAYVEYKSLLNLFNFCVRIRITILTYIV